MKTATNYKPEFLKWVGYAQWCRHSAFLCTPALTASKQSSPKLHGA